MNILATISETFADGPGIRYAIYTAGCSHKCKGCHNPESWDFNQGTPIKKAIKQIIEEIGNNPMLTGITISGGDPFEDPEGLYFLLVEIKSNYKDKDIWLFTGYTISELANQDNEFVNKSLELIDTLVDGPYIESLKIEGEFRGSSNQNIIHNPSLFLLSA